MRGDGVIRRDARAEGETVLVRQISGARAGYWGAAVRLGALAVKPPTPHRAAGGLAEALSLRQVGARARADAARRCGAQQGAR